MPLSIANILKSKRFAHHQLWLGRSIIWLSAALATYILVLFSRGVDIAIAYFDEIAAHHPWSPWLITPLGGMAIAWLARRFANGSQGSGIPQIIVAQQLKGDTKGFASLRIAAAKIVLGTAALGCGYSTGREGPSVQIAASILAFFHRFLPKRFPVDRRDCLLAGGAVGIAAAFNTPLAGVVFAIEELGQRFHARTTGILLTTIVFAGIISIHLQGNYNYFGRLHVPDSNPHLVIPVLLLGVVGGLSGGLFSRLLLIGTGPWRGALGRFKVRHPVLIAGGCGLLVAATGVLTHGMTFGSGYIATQHALNTGGLLPVEFPLGKFFATVMSYIAGVPGGIFAPSLSIGAGLGQSCAVLHLGDLNVTAWTVLGMAAFMAGVTQAPITAFVIVMEMTEGHAMVLALIAVAMLASVLSRNICPPFYHAVAHRMKRTLPADDHA